MKKKKNRVKFECSMNTLVGKIIDTMISRRSMEPYVFQLPIADKIEHFSFDEHFIALETRFLSLGYDCKYKLGSHWISIK